MLGRVKVIIIGVVSVTSLSLLLIGVRSYKERKGIFGKIGRTEQDNGERIKEDLKDIERIKDIKEEIEDIKEGIEDIKGDDKLLIEEVKGGEVSTSNFKIIKGKIGKENNLYNILISKGNLSPKESRSITDKLSKIVDLKVVRDDDYYEIGFGPDLTFDYLLYKKSEKEIYKVEKREDGYRVIKVDVPVQNKLIKRGGIIKESLFTSIKGSGLYPQIVPIFEEAFSYDISFITEQREGDSFKVIAEEEWVKDKFIGYKNVLAMEYNGKKTGRVRVYYFKCPDKSCAGFYNEKGEGIKRSVLRNPLSFFRISSRFSLKRFHPILHRHRAHLGIDLAAPKGTPVWAIADGTVSFKGWKGGAGNLIIIKHKGGLESIYGHLSKFAKGINSGVSVKQRQVIGYVGSTGLSTGPHLHYGLRLNGKYIDPLKYKVAPGPPVPSKFRQEFLESVKKYNRWLDNIEIKP